MSNCLDETIFTPYLVDYIRFSIHMYLFLYPRMTKLNPDNATIQGSLIHVYLDMTNQQIGLTIQQEMLSAFQSFVDATVPNPSMVQIPIKVCSLKDLLPVYLLASFRLTHAIGLQYLICLISLL